MYSGKKSIANSTKPSFDFESLQGKHPQNTSMSERVAMEAGGWPCAPHNLDTIGAKMDFRPE